MTSKHKKTFLLVDDSAFMRGLIKDILVKHDYRVIGEAENGITGAEKYKTLKPDIVTLDLNMNESTGDEALDLILSHDPRANVIMVSSMMGQDFVVDEVMAKGAKAVVVKPIKEKILIEAIQNIINNENT
jgi:two-component system chemotaxis response regulator CheY